MVGCGVDARQRLASQVAGDGVELGGLGESASGGEKRPPHDASLSEVESISHGACIYACMYVLATHAGSAQDRLLRSRHCPAR